MAGADSSAATPRFLQADQSRRRLRISRSSTISGRLQVSGGHLQVDFESFRIYSNRINFSKSDQVHVRLDFIAAGRHHSERSRIAAVLQRHATKHVLSHRSLSRQIVIYFYVVSLF
jgi:hypothetical protein